MEVPGSRGIRRISDSVLSQKDLNPSLFYAKFPEWKLEEDPDKEKHVECMIKLGGWPDRLRDLADYLHTGADRIFDMKTATRLLIGRATPSVFEQGISIHPLWGLPFLPGSSVKGVTRHWALETGQNETDIQTIFGPEPLSEHNDLAARGQVVFLDAVPLQNRCLEKEVLTPHYPKYYRGDANLPSDTEKPDIFFLPAVKQDIPFRFALKLSMKNSETTEDKAILDLAEKWTQSALREFGIGSKTSSSYGYFE
jgi:CRISPR-associated protein Cmr6